MNKVYDKINGLTATKSGKFIFKLNVDSYYELGYINEGLTNSLQLLAFYFEGPSVDEEHSYDIGFAVEAITEIMLQIHESTIESWCSIDDLQIRKEQAFGDITGLESDPGGHKYLEIMVDDFSTLLRLRAGLVSAIRFISEVIKNGVFSFASPHYQALLYSVMRVLPEIIQKINMSISEGWEVMDQVSNSCKVEHKKAS